MSFPRLPITSIRMNPRAPTSRQHRMREYFYLNRAYVRAKQEYQRERRILDEYQRMMGTRNRYYWVQWRLVRQKYIKYRRLQDSYYNRSVGFAFGSSRYLPTRGAPAA